MKTVEKIRVNIPKPRNPFALQARMRKAGEHESEKTARYIRRQQRQRLHHIVLQNDKNNDVDY